MPRCNVEGFPSSGKESSCKAGDTEIWVLGQEDALELLEILEKEMASHSSNLAQKIPWTEEPGRLKFMWSQKESDKTQ